MSDSTNVVPIREANAKANNSNHRALVGVKVVEVQKRADMACSLDNPDACEACGS